MSDLEKNNDINGAENSTENMAGAQPVSETPAAETPAVETPAAETPAVETPAVETPAVEAPAVETPATEAVPQGETLVPQGGGVPQGIPQGAPGIQKSGGKKKGLIVGGALAVLAAAGIALGITLTSNPQNEVLKALSKTMAESEAVSTQLSKDIPALNVPTGKDATSSTFDFSFEGIQSGDADFDNMASVLRGLGLRGTVAQNPADNMAEIDVGLHVGTTDLLNAYIYLAPEAAAFGVPAFSDTMLAAHPSSLVMDVQNSPFAYSIDSTLLKDMQLALENTFSSTSELDMVEAGKIIQKDIGELFTRDVPGVQFQKGPKENGLKTYIVTAPGGEMKTFILSTMRYMLSESPLVEVYRKGFAPTAQQLGKSYEQLVEESVQTFERSLSPQAMQAIVTVGKGRASKVELTLTPEGDASTGELDFAGIGMLWETPGGADSKVDMTMEMLIQGESIHTTVVSSGAVQDDKSYHVEADFGMKMTEATVDFGLQMNFGMDGAVKHTLDVRVNDEYGGDIGLRGELAGTVARGEGDVRYKHDYPTVNLVVGEGEDSFTLRFRASGEERELPADYQPTRGFVYVTEMSEADAERIMAEYSEGMEKLSNLVYSLLLSAY